MGVGACPENFKNKSSAINYLAFKGGFKIAVLDGAKRQIDDKSGMLE